MADITAALVKSLREKSGVGMMDCKKALQETGGEMEAAIDWLRAKGPFQGCQEGRPSRRRRRRHFGDALRRSGDDCGCHRIEC